jgi:hypothetical protein
LVEDAWCETLERLDHYAVGLQKLHCLFDWIRLDIDYLFDTGIDDLACALKTWERVDIDRTPIGSPAGETENRAFLGMDRRAQLDSPARKELPLEIAPTQLLSSHFTIAKVRRSSHLVLLSTLGAKEGRHFFEAALNDLI